MKEINVMKRRGVYELVERSEKANIISVKYVYVSKSNNDRIFVDKKSRIVARNTYKWRKLILKNIYYYYVS